MRYISNWGLALMALLAAQATQGALAANGAPGRAASQATIEVAQKSGGPVITRIVRTTNGYAIEGRGFGTDPHRIAVFVNRDRAIGRDILKVTDRRIELRGRPAPGTPIVVQVGRERTAATRFPSGSSKISTRTMVTRASVGSIPAVQTAQRSDPGKLTLSKEQQVRARAAALKREGKSADQAAQILKDQLKATPAEALRALDRARYPLDKALAAMRHIYKKGPQFIIDLAKAVGIGGRRFIDGFIGAFRERTAEWLFRTLEDAGYDTKDISFSAKSILKLTLWAMGTTYQKLGYKAEKAGDLLYQIYGVAKHRVVDALRRAGYPIAQVGLWAQAKWNMTRAALLKLLDQGGYSFDAIADFARSTWNLTASGMAKLLDSAGFAIDKVANWLGSRFNLTRAKIVEAFHGAQIPVRKAADWLYSQGGTTKSAVVGLLRQGKYSAGNATDWLRQRFNETAGNTIRHLFEGGFNFNQVRDAVAGAFNMGLAQVASLIAQLGFH